MKQLHTEAEWMALYTLVCSPNEAVRGILLSKLKSGHFAYEVTHPLFLYIVDAAVRTGAVPRAEILAQMPGIPHVAWQSFCMFAQSKQPIANEDDARHLVNILDTYRKARLVYSTMSSTLSEIEKEDADFEVLRAEGEKYVLGLSETEDESVLYHMGEGNNVQKLFQKVMSHEQNTGIPTGYDTFDKRASWQHGNLVAICSHFKGGKSMVSYRTALNQAERGYRVLYVAMEMSPEELLSRHLSSISGIEHEKIRLHTFSTYENQTIMKAFAGFNAKLKSGQIRFSFQSLPTITPSQLAARYRAYKYDVIYCDMMNLMEPDGKTKNMSDPDRLNNIGRQLKQTAARMNSVIVALTQLDDKTLELRYSRALQEHVNNLWKWEYKDAQQQTGIIEVEQVSRSWQAFNFKLKVDYGSVSVVDAPLDSDNMMAAWNQSAQQQESLGGMWHGG